MRTSRANYNMMAVSGFAREAAINTFKAPDLSLMVAEGDYLSLNTRRENNANELNGMEEADMIYDNGATGSASFTFEKLQPHHAAFLLAFGLGKVTTVPAGSGFLHTITPLDGDVDNARCNPTFTAVQRLGKTIAKRRMASCVVDGVTLSFSSDDWVKGSGSILATGKFEDSVIEETVNDLASATLLTLAVNGVHGATLEERIDSVQVVRAKIGGGYVFANIVEVSDTVPAVITIESLGGSGSLVDYKILYAPTEPVWCTLPNRVVETPMRVSQMCLHMGGAWDGSAFVGGRPVSSDFMGFEYTLSNNISMEFTTCAGGAFAGRSFRAGRDQKINLSRELRDMLIQHYMGNNEYFGLHLVCEGDVFDTGQKYTLEMIFPRLGLLAAPLSTDNKRVAEKGDLQVLSDETYGSVIVRIKNKVANFAA